MPLNIRDPQAAVLARELANRRGTSMTDAIITALKAEIRREDAKPQLLERVRLIADNLRSQANGTRHKMSKQDIDEMWGN